MANSKQNRALMISILMAASLTAFASLLAQTKRTPSGKQATERILPEKEKEERIRNKVAGLLTSVGLSVGPALPTSDAYRQLRIHWEGLNKGDSAGLVKEEQPATAGVLTRLSSIGKVGAIPRERSVELSTDRMLVVALDGNDAVRWWRIMIDPRLLRAEVGRSAEMQSENYYLTKVDFIIECPDDRLLKQLRFYHPVWNGEAFHLELLGAAPLH